MATFWNEAANVALAQSGERRVVRSASDRQSLQALWEKNTQFPRRYSHPNLPNLAEPLRAGKSTPLVADQWRRRFAYCWTIEHKHDLPHA